MATQWLVSKNGHPVPVLNGISLCSMVDPIKEAQKWFDSYKDILNDFDHIFVLGIGGGYHIDLLLESLPEALITVVEREASLVRGLEKKIIDWGDRVAVLSNPSINHIKSYESFHCVVEQSSYCVLVHPISFSNNPEFYKDIEDFLLGRSTEGLSYISAIKGQTNPYYQDFQKKYNLTGKESIKDIVHLIQKKNVDLSDEDLLWLSLGELIH